MIAYDVDLSPMLEQHDHALLEHAGLEQPRVGAP